MSASERRIAELERRNVELQALIDKKNELGRAFHASSIKLVGVLVSATNALELVSDALSRRDQTEQERHLTQLQLATNLDVIHASLRSARALLGAPPQPQLVTAVSVAAGDA